MYEYRATFIRAVDGDTVDFDVDLGFNTTLRARFRLLGVNTPERGQPGYTEATDAVTAWATGHTLRILTVKDKTEKYGRYLALVYRDDDPVDLAGYLIAESLGVYYNGGARV